MRRSLLVVAVLAAAMPIAACGGSTGSSSTASGSGATTTGATPGGSGGAASAGGTGDAKVDWVDKVCGEIVQLTQAQATAPPNLQGADAQQALKAFDQYLKANIDVVDQTVADLKNIGDAPFDSADEALTALVNGLEAVKKGYLATSDKFSKLDTADPQAAQSALLEAFGQLSAGAGDLGKSMEGVQADPEIEAAAKKAPYCQRLDVTSPPTPTS